MVEFEPGDSKAILRLLHPFQIEMFAEMTEEWCLLFLQSKSESVQEVTRHRWSLWTYVTVNCFVHAGACAILLKWASQVAGSLGVWRSLEARFLGMEEAPSSNLGTSTIEFKREASLNLGNWSNPSKAAVRTEIQILVSRFSRYRYPGPLHSEIRGQIY